MKNVINNSDFLSVTYTNSQKKPIISKKSVNLHARFAYIDIFRNYMYINVVIISVFATVGQTIYKKC